MIQKKCDISNCYQDVLIISVSLLIWNSYKSNANDDQNFLGFDGGKI